MRRHLSIALTLLLFPMCSTVYAQEDECYIAGADIPLTDHLETEDPAIVWTGTEHGVVWQDTRQDLWGIYFARFDAALNKIGDDIRLTTGGDNPAIVWTGTEYGVAWLGGGVYFTRLDASGAKIGDDILVSTCSNDAYAPSLVWTGSEFGVAYQDLRVGKEEIFFSRLDASGNKIGDDVEVSNRPSDSTTPSLVWTGSEYGVAWLDYRGLAPEVYFTRLDASGAEIGDDIQVTSSSGADWQSLVWNGTGYGMAYRAGEDIYFVGLDRYGNGLGDPTYVWGASGFVFGPVLAWNGGGYGVVWADDQYCDVYSVTFAYLDAQGNRLDQVHLAGWYTGFCVLDQRPALAWNGIDFPVAWTDLTIPYNFSVYFNGISCCDLSDRDSDGFSECAGDCDDWSPEINPDAPEICDDMLDNDCDDLLNAADPYCVDLDGDGLAADGDNSGVISDTPCTTGQTADCDDNCVMDPNPSQADGDLDGAGDACEDCPSNSFLQETGLCGCRVPDQHETSVQITDSVDDSEFASMAWTGSEYAVVWEDRRDGGPEIYFALLDSRGNKIGTDIRVTNAQSSESPSIAWTGSEFGVAYQDGRDGNEIYFSRLDASGQRIGSDVRVTSTLDRDEYGPSLAWTGTEYGIAWVDDYGLYRWLRFTRLDSSGAEISDVTTVSPCTLSSFFYEPPALAWTGSQFGIAYRDDRDGNHEIYFSRLDASGDKIGGDVRVTNASGSSLSSSLAWTGAEYGVAWHDDREGNEEIYFTRLDASGVEIGDDIRLTDHLSGAASPFLIYTGAAYGVAWIDHRTGEREIWFNQLDTSGAQMGVDLQLSIGADPLVREPVIGWTGTDYGFAWHRRDDASDSQIYFDWLTCYCDDADDDSDGYSECDGDCDDDPATGYALNPGVMENCSDAIDNDCDQLVDADDPYCMDDDGDGVLADGDNSGSTTDNRCATGQVSGCDDNCWDVYNPGQEDGDGDGFGDACDLCPEDSDKIVERICGCGVPDSDMDSDGTVGCIDNCPEIANDQTDADDDGRGDVCDCSYLDDQVWDLPGETGALVFDSSGNLVWDAPAEPGATVVIYDTVRSESAADFVARRVCVEWDDGSDTTAWDGDEPAPGAAFFYVVLAENGCGAGPAGADSSGLPREVRACP